MAATSDEEMESLLSSFDQIYEEFKDGVTEIQLLKSSCSAELKRREALENTCNSLRIGLALLDSTFYCEISILAYEFCVLLISFTFI
ncbi:hypothetical protein HHK36_021062 [Tetracentron sinense]|uniref:Uncharacterized protein n=1 Tax=Tetracentron sinense TaxID=13715 RepID=A0A834YRE2_TETSI|nr:hypothetical protein HHK36_021062 [Tetracentron sinense]